MSEADLLLGLLKKARIELGVRTAPALIRINTSCPYCKEVFNGTVSANGNSPAPGVVSLCTACANILRFDENLQFIKLTPESWQAMGEKFQRFLKRQQRELIEKLECK